MYDLVTFPYVRFVLCVYILRLILAYIIFVKRMSCCLMNNSALIYTIIFINEIKIHCRFVTNHLSIFDDTYIKL